jgi:hypothetical protein
VEQAVDRCDLTPEPVSYYTGALLDADTATNPRERRQSVFAAALEIEAEVPLRPG